MHSEPNLADRSPHFSTGNRLTNGADRLTHALDDRLERLARAGVDAVSDYTHAISSAARAAAEKLKANGLREVADNTDNFAGRIDHLRTSVESTDAARHARGLREFVYRQPALSVGIAAVVGYAAVKFLSEASGRHHEDF